MNLLDEPVVFRTQLGNIGAALLESGQKPLVLQFMKSLAQCRLPDAESRCPLELNNSIRRRAIP